MSTPPVFRVYHAAFSDIPPGNNPCTCGTHGRNNWRHKIRNPMRRRSRFCPRKVPRMRVPRAARSGIESGSLPCKPGKNGRGSAPPAPIPRQGRQGSAARSGAPRYSPVVLPPCGFAPFGAATPGFPPPAPPGKLPKTGGTTLPPAPTPRRARGR